MYEQIKEIIKKAKDGDSTAIGRLYEENRPTGLLIAWKYVKNQDDAEDMYQDAFLKAINNIERFDETKDFGPWLNTIIANTCKNFLVKKRAVNFSDMSDEENEFVDTLDSKDKESMPEVSYDRKEFMGIMDSIIDELPQAQREAVALFYYKEMSVKEIAAFQDVSEDTVKSRLNYSRKKVGAAVEEYERKTGIKLHGVIIIPLMFTLFYQKSVHAAEAEALLAGISKGAAAASVGTAAKTASAGAKKAASFGARKAIKATAVKIAIPVAATAVIGGTAYSALKPRPEPVAEEVSQEPERDALDNLFRELSGDDSLRIDIIGRLNDVKPADDGTYRVSLDHVYLWYRAVNENGELVDIPETYNIVFDKYRIPRVTEWDLNESRPPTVYHYMGDGTFEISADADAVLKHIDSGMGDDYFATERLLLDEVCRTGLDNYEFYNKDRLSVVFATENWPALLIEEAPYVNEAISFVVTSSENGGLPQ